MYNHEMEPVKTILINKFPKIDFIDKSENNELYLEFLLPFNKEYKFSIWQSLDGSYATIGAKLLIHNYNKYYFWHYPFEPYWTEIVEEKIKECEKFITEQLKILTIYPSRIIQKNNWFTQTFICEIFRNNEWIIFYKHKAFKTNFDFPQIEGRQKIYT